MPVTQLSAKLRDIIATISTQGSNADLLQRLRAGILKEIIRWRDGDGNIAVHYESDVTTYYEPDTPREWKYSEMRTTVSASGNNIEQQAFLDQPMRAARPSALIHADGIIEEAFHELTEGVNCAIYQLSKHRGVEYEEVEAEMRSLYMKMSGEELEVVTPRLVMQWCEAKNYSCYFLVANQLHSRIQRSNTAIAFSWFDDHMYLYSDANWCKHMTPKSISAPKKTIV